MSQRITEKFSEFCRVLGMRENQHYPALLGRSDKRVGQRGFWVSLSDVASQQNSLGPVAGLHARLPGKYRAGVRVQESGV